MTIGILLHPYDEDKPAGLARTILGYTTGILEVDGSENEYIIFVKKKSKKDPQLPGNWKLHVLGEGMFWLDRMRNAPRADVYIFNTPVMPFFWHPPKSIVIVLDFAYIYIPTKNFRTFIHNKLLRWYHGRSMKKADHIVSITQTTQGEIEKLYGINSEKITIVYPGFDKICALPGEKINTPLKFFLFIGVLKNRKNPFTAIKAFVEFHKHHPDYTLVVAGKGGGSYYEKMLKYVREYNVEDSVLFIGFVSDNQLSYLYKHARALVFPTTFEGGFCLPAFEAMDCGLPVISSGQGPFESLEETLEDGALLVDPLNVSKVAGAMRRVVEESGLREQLIQKGFAQSKKFSWNKAGRELLAVVDKLA